MSLSTIAMPCNASGWFDLDLGGSYGLVSYDWVRLRPHTPPPSPRCSAHGASRPPLTQGRLAAPHRWHHRATPSSCGRTPSRWTPRSAW
jgi:hypothetical protein